MTPETGIRLEREGAVLAETFEELNAVLSEDGIRAWPADLSGAPADVRGLLNKGTLTESETEHVKAHFLLSRERLLEVIADAGRQPHLPDGGALSSFCIETRINYPQLHVIDKALDYSGFYPFHINVGEDGSGTDEVGQVLSGSNMQYRFRLANSEIVTLSLSCPSPGRGWLFTFDGGAPHGGILKDTPAGTKVLVQAIGPAKFHCRYVD